MSPPSPPIQLIPITEIEILNPRSRNRKAFEELVDSIATLGLKKPITVSPSPNGSGYRLVCGQGRMEAFMELDQTTIPAIVIDATSDDCYIMSLVEKSGSTTSLTSRTDRRGHRASRPRPQSRPDGQKGRIQLGVCVGDLPLG